MPTFSHEDKRSDGVLRHLAQAADHISGICFKTGPPRRIGVELEWTVHRSDAPAAYLEAADLRTALGTHAPSALGNPHSGAVLPGGGAVTVEPGGQLEISSAPAGSLTELHQSLSADQAHLTALLARSGLVLGDTGLDPYRSPRRMLQTPRYAAMQRSFDAAGRHGRTMMCSTAGMQICLDAGTERQLPHRWGALHEMGPALLAAFATSGRHAGRDTGWASARMATWYGIDPGRTRPVSTPGDLATGWADYALAAPLLCVRRGEQSWDVPAGVSFADWIDGALGDPPRVDDLDYHLSTLFPPVRPRGYLEVRYLDTQPGTEWIAPAAVVTALLADDATTDAARAVAAATAGEWVTAARAGLADPAIRRTATDLLDLACRNLDSTGLPPAVRDEVTDIVDRRLERAGTRKDAHR
ncbi:ergothioneine biosynthesis glutamate--cysteine ligase EgtA [Actinoplanes sp. ATCC 53533]|uniref:ergothioneine biosynthesis glutamate--cysteine ligase EgtA n=1 Tax=Actinoplanes sp. ATCC 53533 TaxID=1288362 RepID=UPI000F7B4F82|nr:ergothioneine biosynthesis glutamate--cysteine ligase EgtA [Actinoplanes sp. ATCC 53533]RSM67853.1 ergothioneine biosynthesis glutamate--cysteine ligase EgtA [Actinoplanes sp. ATCC 53533]